MTAEIDWAALAVFVLLLGLVTAIGFGRAMAASQDPRGSALALFMYPHALTGILASASANTIRKNAMLLPAYSMVLALVALMGLIGHVAGLKLSNNNDVVPPGWFAGLPSRRSRSAPSFPPRS